MNKFDDKHYWEIGKAGCPLNKIMILKKQDSGLRKLIEYLKILIIGSLY